MNDHRYLHCTPVYTDAISRLNQVERLPDGRLFTVACFSKSNNGGRFSKEPVTQFIMGRVSEDEGKTWKTPTFVYELPDRDPMLILGEFLIDRDGRIHLFFLRIQNIDWNLVSTKGDITYLRMDNERGENPIYKKIDCLDRYTGSMNNILQLDDGRIIAPFSTIAGIKGSTFVSGVVYSDDAGETWKASNDVAVVSDETHLESGAVEPVVVEAAPGVLVMLIRTVLSHIWYAVSYNKGETWSESKPTLIPASNAPSVPLKLKDGRIFLCWNNVLGEPMTGVRYSFARQCLHAAVSKDGLKTLDGVRVIVRKRVCDPDDMLNCYPFASYADDDEIFIRPFSVNNDSVHWGDAQGTLLRMRPDDLLETKVEDGFEEWITDCPVDEGGLHLQATKEGIGCACVNFPYAEEGEITLASDGLTAANGVKIMLADNYLDRLTFLPENQKKQQADTVKPYVEAVLPCGKEWKFSWNTTALKITSGAETVTLSLNDWKRGFNHLILLSEGSAKMDLNHFTMTVIRGGMKTGIEY